MNAVLTVGELREQIADLSDNDQVCIEIHDADEIGNIGEDLYPFCIDVIEGIELKGGEKVREVRFSMLNQKYFKGE